jgi:hypothetical protein
MLSYLLGFEFLLQFAICGLFSGGWKWRFKEVTEAGIWWLTPVIPATQETEIRRIEVQSQPRQIIQETLSQKYPTQDRAGRMGQGVGPEFKPQYHKKK